jgi:riboflavin biosynthesis pyrimidine reductase
MGTSLPDMDVRRLHPDPTTVEAARALGEIDFNALAHPDRPYVVANMVASADGRTTVEGRSAPLSDPADRALFHALRARVDAVLAGTGTLRAERYRRLIRQPERREERRARGLEPDPVAVVLTRSGNLPDIEMLTDPEQPRAVFGGDDADPATAFRRLREEHGVRSLLCEGGAVLLGSLLRAELVDELFLCLAPMLAGGEGQVTVAGPALHPPVTLQLVHVLEHENSLFMRYRIELGRG